jgi:hypothetical protein
MNLREQEAENIYHVHDIAFDKQFMMFQPNWAYNFRVHKNDTVFG